ncbi:hypothetical protein TWF481_010031 [Arthrobotrys musiformis]|uniref:Semialdehyde dehydrogenase NAD-binding domain-containing protein n=1 Tax=Arthrobotrys musiformis TaxID=47236 RepID=A0AAV9VZI7_9PEZI
MTKVFLLGATGYLGGTILNRLITTHPNFSITAIARTQEKADKITATYPSVRTIVANLDSSDILISESSTADIIITAADCDHPGHIKDIYEGMAKNTSGKPIYLIHSSGTAVLSDLSLAKAGEKEQSAALDKVWDDVGDFEGIRNLPAEQLHQNVDSLVRAPPLGRNPNIRYAIVCPPMIYGEGSGPVRRLNSLAPWLSEAILKNGKGFTVGKGENSWSNVHIDDLTDLYIRLVGESLKEGGGRASWGQDGGWYFAENGRRTWGDIAREITKIAHEKGYLRSEEVEALGVEKAKELNPVGPYAWGTNSLSRASRARKELGWAPHGESLGETILGDVNIAAKRLGIST